MKNYLTRENISAVGVAFVLSFVVFLGIQNSALLTADVAGTQVEFTDESDLVSYVDGQQVHIAVSKKLPTDVVGISMLIFYNTESVKIERDAIDSPYTLSYATASPGRASLSLAGDLSTLSVGQSLVVFDLLGEARDMTISDIVVEFEDGSTDRLSLAIK